MKELRFFLILFYLVFNISETQAKNASDLIRNTKEQLYYLHEHHNVETSKGNPKASWHIHFIVATKSELNFSLTMLTKNLSHDKK